MTVILIRLVIVYAFLTLIVRFMGKRQIGEMQMSELIVAFMLSELAALPVTDTSIPLLYAIVPILLLAVLEILTSYAFLCSQKLARIVSGAPQVLIRDGRIDRMMLRYARMTLPELMGELRLKGILYSLCADFDSTAEYVEHDGERYGLLEKIFGFVVSEYNKDCSLDALSAATSYHYVYLSRYFKKCTGLSFTEYVNTYRVNEACYLLRNGEQSILETAFNCGYDSLRSFNRNFKKIMQITPVEYRAQA